MSRAHRSLPFVAAIFALLLWAQQAAFTHDLSHLAAWAGASTAELDNDAHAAAPSQAQAAAAGADKAGYCEHCFVYAQLGAVASGVVFAVQTHSAVFAAPPLRWRHDPLAPIRHALGRGPPSAF